MVYMGSKNRIAKHIIPYFNFDGMDNYIEPFVGGCNMIDKIQAPVNKIGYDNNKYLIAMFKALMNGERFEYDISKELYDKVRISYKTDSNEYSDSFKGWVGFTSSYGGLFFSSYNGLCKKENYQKEQENSIIKQIRDFSKKVQLLYSDYKNIIIPKKSIIYCDPPYKNTAKYHSDFNHDEFYEWIEINLENTKLFYISEFTAPSEYKEVMKISRNCLSRNGNRLTERLFIHKSQEHLINNPTLF